MDDLNNVNVDGVKSIDPEVASNYLDCIIKKSEEVGTETFAAGIE